MKKKVSNSISIVIPCYNSSLSIKELVERIDATMTSNSYKYEVICVNDCSKDTTIDVLTSLSEKYTTLKVIDLVYNVGQFRALLCAIEHASGDIIVTMDDDLQHSPEDIPLLVETLKSNPKTDVVIASYKEKKHSMYRNAGTMLVRLVDKYIFNKPETIKTTSFRAMPKEFAKALSAHKTKFPVIGPLILSLTKNIVNVEVEHKKRKYGKSNYTLGKLITATFNNIFNFSSAPLKFISILGSVAALISLIVTLVTVIRYLVGGIGLPGWTSLIVFVNFYCGLILLSIGIIGEYLIRILKESNGSPCYIIRKKINFEDDK